MKHYLKVVECAIEHNSKFLVIKRPEGGHAGGLLSFPGGKVEELDEQKGWDILRSAVKREVLEEVGLDLKDDLKYICSNYFLGTNKVHVITSIFYCRIKKTDLKITASKREVSEYYWLTAQEINNNDKATEWLKKYTTYINHLE